MVDLVRLPAAAAPAPMATPAAPPPMSAAAPAPMAPAAAPTPVLYGGHGVGGCGRLADRGGANRDRRGRERCGERQPGAGRGNQEILPHRTSPPCPLIDGQRFREQSPLCFQWLKRPEGSLNGSKSFHSP